MVTAASADSYLYLSQEKAINSSYIYEMPKLEWNYYTGAGMFFGNKCEYISEFEGALVYTAPRSSMFSLNHHSIQAEWNVGVQVGAFWATYSIGDRHYIAGNSDGIPEGDELRNTAKVGITF